MKIRKGDTVKVLYGKDAGKSAKVLKVIDKLGKVVVDGVNVYKRHLKGDGQKRESAIVNIVKPMDSAKVMVVCPNCGKTTRVAMKLDEKTGNQLRFCKKCGKQMDEVVVKKAKKDDKKTEEKVEAKAKVKTNKISKK